MKSLVAAVLLILAWGLAGCRSMDHAIGVDGDEHYDVVNGQLVPPKPRASTGIHEQDRLADAGIEPTQRERVNFLVRKTPRGRSDVLHETIRKRLMRVQTLIQQQNPMHAWRELAPLKQLDEARMYYAEDMRLLEQEIRRAMDRPHVVNEGIITESRAVNEVMDRYRLPDSYGQTRIITPNLPPLQLPPGRMEEVLNTRVEAIDLIDADVAAIVDALRAVVGLNVIADQALQSDQQLTIHVRDVPLHELLSYVSRNMGIAFHLGENVVWVTQALTPDDNGPQLETRVYSLRKGYIPGGSTAAGGFGSGLGAATGAPAGQGQDDLFDALTDFLEDNPYNPPNTKFQIYRNRNLLVIRNSRANLRLAEEIIRQFDAVPKQVLIEARFITINQTDLWQLGGELQNITYDGGESFQAQGQVALPAFSQGMAENQLEVSGILDNFSYSVVIQALERMGSTRTLSAPRITVLNNQAASIRRGKTLYYFRDFEVEQVVTDNVISSRMVPSGSAEELELGISLSTTPSIGNDGRSVLLSLAAEIAGPAASFVSRNDVSLPEFPESTLQTSVGVHSGQTVVLGGMITSEDSEIESKVPLLGDIPLLGFLFRKRERNHNPEHLLIFVTATIIDLDGRFNQVLEEFEVEFD